MKIQELLSDIENKNLLLPEFQREYVWSREQAKQLFVSLVKQYPVGSLLFWKTGNPPELKNVDALPDKIGTIQIILDGQQRLTSLYLLINGEVPPYYKEQEISVDPRELHFNLETGEFQYYQASRMRENPLWQSVANCFSEKSLNVFELAKNQEEDPEKILELAQRYSNNLNRLKNIKEIQLSVQTVPAHASLDEAIDIFDRVNSQGTKLTDAELALTHVTGKWATARRVFKEKIEELNKKDFCFDLTFMTRALTGIVCKRALFETIHGRQKEELISSWSQVSKILDYLVNILPHSASVHSTEDLNSSNVLIPLIVFLSLNNGKFQTDISIKHAIHWLYSAHIWARYTAQTDQRLEQDLSIVVREKVPWEALRSQIIDQRGRIEVKGTDFEGRTAQHPLYRMSYILAKAHSAIDWFNGAPLGTLHGDSYRIHSHHIFPQSLLYEKLYDSDSHLDRKKVNEIANRAFLTADTNRSLSNTPPEEYFPKVEERYPGALVKQFVPMDPELWKVWRYEDFLAVRRENIARKLNEIMNALITEPEEPHERPITELIKLGESLNLEFKSTLQWDIIQNQQNKQLRHSVLKTITAFLNTSGGTLLIGVEDDGNIYGIGNDLKLVKNSHDKFIQLIISLISEHIGVEYSGFIKVKLEELNGKCICVVDVDRAPEPIYLKGTKGKEFFIRVGNTSRPIDTEETVAYVNMHWE